ncbi:MAG: excinuclease ABC subunit UvrA, partial [Chloroflexota bacterium]|nr:excinuclease ABC subunit UvrA [Chloroflexota bacterium]
MPQETIYIKGAREHNLKNIDVTIPRDQLVVITGVSGSGKSSLAFDTIYAEGQRRYVESLSAYARQFLGRMDKPDVDYIEGLSPAISIDQKGVSHNPRSTVGTVTEVYDYLRLLFARVGKPHCPQCGRAVVRQSVQQIADAVFDLPKESRIMLMAPVVRDRKGEYKDVFEDARKRGFVRVQVDGQVRDLSETITLNKNYRHTIQVVVDRLVINADLEQSRVHESLETAMRLAEGMVTVAVLPDSSTDNGTAPEPEQATGRRRRASQSSGNQEIIFSEQFACPYCQISFGEIEPRTFSFNNPHGACPECTGLGFRLEMDPELVVPNPALSLAEGAIAPWMRPGTAHGVHASMLNSLARAHDFEMSTPFRDLPESVQHLLLQGDRTTRFTMRHRTHRGREFTWQTTYEGVIPNLMRRYRDTESDHVRSEIQRFMAQRPCPSCGGRRLKPEALAVTVCGRDIMQVCSQNIERALEWSEAIRSEDPANVESNLALNGRDRYIAQQILKEIDNRLRFLTEIGLHYLTLERTAYTLSGGEAQRIRLATQIGSGLMGVLYVCDEPTIGLHPADDHRLIATLKRLRDLGNTVLLVEHDEAVMRAADHIVDLGPGAGEHGGEVVAEGPLDAVMSSDASLTGAYLSGRKQIPLPHGRRTGSGDVITLSGARANNLKNVDVEFPLGKLVVITGVSGSGKSTLVNEVLYKKLAQTFYRAKDRPGEHDSVAGLDAIDKVVDIDQSPIGRTPRSNPATYTGAFTPIREMFAKLPEARSRGYQPGRFSFNVKGGRCEACEGGGYIQIEMQFLPDVTVPCEVCNGARYNREALEVKFHDKSISDVLNMTVEEALDLFQNLPRVRSKLETLRDVGLGYIRLGQPATTLSGGEAQRVKLSTELSKRATGRTLYILDEPTTGLSFEDVAALMRVLHRLVDAGNTVIVIEHHLDVIKNADWIVDLGPGAGEHGGEVIATGTPEDVMAIERSHTGEYL